MRICLDTSAYSNYRRSWPEIVDLVSRAEWVGLPAVVIGELESGFRRGSQRLANSELLSTFIDHGRVEVLALDQKIAEVYADIHNEVLSVGQPIPTNDIWIAASSVGYGSTLVTYDNHFRIITRLGAIVL